MMMLMCHAGEQRYAIPARAVVEVAPMVTLQQTACCGLQPAGMCIFRGQTVPVWDLSQLVTGHPSPRRWTTRILLLREPADERAGIWGLVVEAVAPEDLPQETVATTGQQERRHGLAQWGPLLLDEQGLYQLVDLSLLRATICGQDPGSGPS